MRTDGRKRILLTVPHLSRAAAPYRDMIAIAKYLPREEFDLTICSAGSRGHGETGEILNQLGRRYLVARFRPTGRSVQEVLASFHAQAQLDRLGPFDIQHSIMGTSSPYEALFSKYKSRSHVHSQIDMTDGGHPLLFRIKLRLASKIISVSGSVRKFILSHGINPAKVKTIYNGIDFEEVDAALLSDPPARNGLILSVGLVVRRKRHEDAIRSIAMIAKEFQNVRLGIAGRVVEPDYYEELKKLVNDLGLFSRVEFLGIRKDILQLMQQASALIHCADSEGLPWVVLEAMAVGLPVIGSSIDPIQEIVDPEKTGLIVGLGDVLGYANAIRKVMTQPQFSDLLARNGRHSVEQRFSARSMVQQIAGVYSELAA